MFLDPGKSSDIFNLVSVVKWTLFLTNRVLGFKYVVLHLHPLSSQLESTFASLG